MNETFDFAVGGLLLKAHRQTPAMSVTLPFPETPPSIHTTKKANEIRDLTLVIAIGAITLAFPAVSNRALYAHTNFVSFPRDLQSVGQSISISSKSPLPVEITSMLACSGRTCLSVVEFPIFDSSRH